MVKYSPKENTYKEMYLINKFEKDVMENSLQNMRNDKTKTNQKVPVSITTSSENDKNAIETPNKKKTQSEQGNELIVSNENDIEGFTPEILNSSIEKEKLPNDKPLSVNENTPTSKKRIDRNISRNNSLLTPSDLKRTPHNSTPLDRDNILEKGLTQIHRRMIFLFRHRVSNEFRIQKNERLKRLKRYQRMKRSSMELKMLNYQTKE